MRVVDKALGGSVDVFNPSALFSLSPPHLLKQTGKQDVSSIHLTLHMQLKKKYKCFIFSLI